MHEYLFTSESVSEGHPDKVCDLVADTLLDAYLTQDPDTRAGCEVLYKGDRMIIAGEVTTTAVIDPDRLARQVLDQVGYRPTRTVHNSHTVRVETLITTQSPEIRHATTSANDAPSTLGASDQGIMFGFACRDTPTLMPLPIALAHQLGTAIANHRHQGTPPWLLPDGKTAVTVRYRNHRPVAVTNVLIAAQHTPDVTPGQVAEWAKDAVIPDVLGDWLTPDVTIHINPSGPFTLGGPQIDTGLTGRKLVVDTYGGMARIGGGALSGKDPTKLDRSGAYYCRWIARQLIQAGLAERAEIQISYALGLAQPLSVHVDTFGTGNPQDAAAYVAGFDFRPAAILSRLNLRKPIYRRTVNYGHFGKAGLPWEETPL
jgi:S-adenosylmethionine synthetase